jgi:hypothetical protein
VDPELKAPRDIKPADADRTDTLKAGLADRIAPDFWKQLAERIGGNSKTEPDDKEQTP